MAAMHTPLDEAVAVAETRAEKGGTEYLARACGVSRQFLNRMRREYRDAGAPPRALRDHAPAIEAALGGAVTVEKLFPGVRWLRDEAGAVVGYTVALRPITCDAPAANDDTAPAQGEGPVEGAS